MTKLFDIAYPEIILHWSVHAMEVGISIKELLGL